MFDVLLGEPSLLCLAVWLLRLLAAQESRVTSKLPGPGDEVSAFRGIRFPSPLLPHPQEKRTSFPGTFGIMDANKIAFNIDTYPRDGAR